jgi:hypothetical protein
LIQGRVAAFQHVAFGSHDQEPLKPVAAQPVELALEAFAFSRTTGDKIGNALALNREDFLEALSDMAYADIEKHRAWFRARYRRRHEWELAHAAAYRQANRKRIAKRQRRWIRKKFKAKPDLATSSCRPGRLAPGAAENAVPETSPVWKPSWGAPGGRSLGTSSRNSRRTAECETTLGRPSRLITGSQ